MKIVLAGAGTAGHIEPALAVADAWRREYPNCEFEFVEDLEVAAEPDAADGTRRRRRVA